MSETQAETCSLRARIFRSLLLALLSGADRRCRITVAHDFDPSAGTQNFTSRDNGTFSTGQVGQHWKHTFSGT